MNFLELYTQKRLIGAHRGVSSIHPENTLSSVKASIGISDFIEVDVQLSSDGKAVIIHDDTLLRTTDVSKFDSFKAKYPYKVSSFSFDELSKLDYGSWFYKDNNKKEKEPLLTHFDLLNFAKKYELYLNIEIKDIHNEFDDTQVVSTVLKEIQNTAMEDKVIISSFRHEYLSLVKQTIPTLPTAALVEDTHPENLIEYLQKLQVECYNLNDELVDEKSVKLLQDNGFFVNVYTVNDPKRKDELFKMGVNGIFTDFPQLF